MTSAISVSSIGFRSCDGVSQIKGIVWAQERSAGAHGAAPRAVIQLVHGMSEHAARYDEFARYLVGRGFVVCAADHVGHGKSAPSLDKLGCLPAQGGKEVLIDDVHELRRTVAARFSRQTPYVMFGHSMGSFVVRAYVTRYAEGLSGAIICGTAQQSRALSKMGHILASRLAATKGSDTKSPLLHSLGAGSFSKKISDARTEFDWLSSDPAVVDAFIEDELCGAVFSVGGYATLTDLTYEVATRECAAKVPAALPFLFVAGAKDPVGSFGKGVHEAAEMLKSAGVQRVDEILYENMRHEILNEPERDCVYNDVANWIEEYACEKPTL